MGKTAPCRQYAIPGGLGQRLFEALETYSLLDERRLRRLRDIYVVRLSAHPAIRFLGRPGDSTFPPSHPLCFALVGNRTDTQTQESYYMTKPERSDMNVFRTALCGLVTVLNDWKQLFDMHSKT
jgi:hypothetical protein